MFFYNFFLVTQNFLVDTNYTFHMAYLWVKNENVNGEEGALL